MDYEPDSAVGRKTTVCLFSKSIASSLVLLSLTIETLIVYHFFTDAILLGFSAFGVVLFLVMDNYATLDRVVFQRIEHTLGVKIVPFSRLEGGGSFFDNQKNMKLIMAANTVFGMSLMIHCWWRGIFV
jgi:hypothetical protein